MLYINIPKINNKIKDIHTTQNTDNKISHHNGFVESFLNIMKNNIKPRIYKNNIIIL